MSFMCVICLDTLANSPPDENKSNLVATKCGHVFHQKCLQQWFSEQKPSSKDCPNCNQRIEETEVLKVWLNQDQDTEEFNAKFNLIKVKLKIIENLQAENDKLKTSAERDSMLLDIMRYEYNELQNRKISETTKLTDILKEVYDDFAKKEAIFKKSIGKLETTIKEVKQEIEGLKKPSHICKKYGKRKISRVGNSECTPPKMCQKSLRSSNLNCNVLHIPHFEKVSIPSASFTFENSPSKIKCEASAKFCSKSKWQAEDKSSMSHPFRYSMPNLFVSASGEAPINSEIQEIVPQIFAPGSD